MSTHSTDKTFAINTALIEAARLKADAARRGEAPGFIARQLDSLARGAVLARLRGIQHGRLRLVDHSIGASSDRHSFGQPTERAPLDVTVRVHDPRFYADVAFGGSIGAGEAYMQGWWSTDDLTGAMRILLQNREVLDGMETGLARLAEPVRKALHWASRNTRQGSRRNISAHYDLGNDFFRLFLDPTLMYSSAVFERADMTLEEASIAKLDRICRKLDLKSGERVLEIGTGWGGFALHAAKHYGVHVTTTTISRQQHDLAKERIEAAGLKGTQMGGAQVSEKHANFIVNPDGKATASAIEMLIGRIQMEVAEKSGISLVREVRIVGDVDWQSRQEREGA